MSDRITVEVEDEFTMFGLPATLVVELETERGYIIRVPIGDHTSFYSGRDYSTITIPVGGEILRRVKDAKNAADQRCL